MKNSFLIGNETARVLYEYVKDLPIIDYHNHLSVADISQNKRYTDVYEMWIKPDPYKHRAMRMCGVEEKYITGNAEGKEKFIKWWETIPKLIGNPLYHWCAMELETVFGITAVLDGKNAENIYNMCNEYLEKNIVTVSYLLEKFRVEYACPCASLVDDISMFDGLGSLAPSLRGDDITAVNGDFVKKLSSLTGVQIDGMESFKKAVRIRLEAFCKAGCRFSDHALDNGFKYYRDDGENGERFKLMLNGVANEEDKERLSSYILTFLGEEYARLGFVMQLHIGAQRYTSSVLRKAAGAAGGFAGIGNSVDVVSLTEFLDTLDCSCCRLPKTVLFTLNPSDNALISVLSGSYSRDGVSGLVTQGPAWWWCDHKSGICNMLENAASFGVLSNFVGMTTDSRSFLSFVRHDYFRRILCDVIGSMAEKGDIFCTVDELKKLCLKMCYENASKGVK